MVSFYYNNGQYAMDDNIIEQWKNSLDPEKQRRGYAREALKKYLISNNGNYDDEKNMQLFLDCKGPSMKYEYVSRRTTEAELFNK